jgi:hypothetical protein
MFFIFESNFEFSAASISANGVWSGALDTVAALSGAAGVLEAAGFPTVVGGAALS